MAHNVEPLRPRCQPVSREPNASARCAPVDWSPRHRTGGHAMVSSSLLRRLAVDPVRRALPSRAFARLCLVVAAVTVGLAVWLGTGLGGAWATQTASNFA